MKKEYEVKTYGGGDKKTERFPYTAQGLSDAIDQCQYEAYAEAQRPDGEA